MFIIDIDRPYQKYPLTKKTYDTVKFR